MALRRADTCSACRTPLLAGTKAQWDSAARTVTCLACAGRTAAVDIGVPGASARKEYERRHAKRDRQIEKEWGTGPIGRFVKAISDDPHSTTAWSQGAKGEEQAAKLLHERLGDDAVLLHDRRVPKTKGNIDHIAVAASGVWIIDTKCYKGKVQRRDVGSSFRTDIRLYVDGRDRTRAVDGLGWQVDAVRAALDEESIPLHPALNFVGAEWPILLAKPFQLNGVWISRPVPLAQLVRGSGPLVRDDVRRVAGRLADRLPANRP